jgi:hypothetical protein
MTFTAIDFETATAYLPVRLELFQYKTESSQMNL